MQFAPDLPDLISALSAKPPMLFAIRSDFNFAKQTFSAMKSPNQLKKALAAQAKTSLSRRPFFKALCFRDTQVEKPVVVASFSFPHDAQIARASLESAGIPATVADEHTINM